MSARRLCSIVILCLFIGACEKPHKPGPRAKERDPERTLNDVLVEETGKYYLPGTPTNCKPQSAKIVTTDYMLKLHVTFTEFGQSHEYDALLGPCSSAEVDNNGTFQLKGGWVCLAGHWATSPVGRSYPAEVPTTQITKWAWVETKSTLAGAEGSCLVLHLDRENGAKDDWVYYVDGTSAWVEPPPSGTTYSWTDRDEFQHFDQNGVRTSKSLSDPANATQHSWLQEKLVLAALTGVYP